MQTTLNQVVSRVLPLLQVAGDWPLLVELLLGFSLFILVSSLWTGWQRRLVESLGSGQHVDNLLLRRQHPPCSDLSAPVPASRSLRAHGICSWHW